MLTDGDHQRVAAYWAWDRGTPAAYRRYSNGRCDSWLRCPCRSEYQDCVERKHSADGLVGTQTVVAAGHTFIHLDPTVFPDPHTFKPDRWLEPSKDLEQHLVAFSRGVRQCIGVK